MNNKSGFTLIELLVVIAIIGILAAVVIGSLNDARSGGQNASIKQSLSNARSQAEIVHDAANYSYEDVCGLNGETRVTDLIQAAVAVTGSTVTYAQATHGDMTAIPTNSSTDAALRAPACHSTSEAFVIQVPMASSDDRFWCVDSAGASKETAAMAQDDLECPAA